MFDFLKRFHTDPARLPQTVERDPLRYEKEKTIAQSSNVRKRLALAKDPRTHQEILFYLAKEDPDPAVRLAVARNMSTPVQASPMLAGDGSEDVRMALARRLVTLLPELGKETHSQLYAFAVQAFATLALDEVLKIRIALSSALRDHAAAPPAVVGQLAKDVEREVSEPILRYCVVLSDDILLDILSTHPASWAVQAIAGRAQVSGIVSQAVIDADDVPAGKILLKNAGADIGEGLLQDIVEKARVYSEWQGPIAMRKNLPAAAARALAEFADASVRDVLLEREDFDQQTIDEIAGVVKRRLAFAQELIPGESVADHVARLEKKRKLNEEAVADALGMRDKDFVVHAVARLARAQPETVESVFRMRKARPVVALCWRAGLSMRFALRLQQEMALVPPKELLYPRDGTDYPMTDEELRWQLEFLGFKAA
ncbi:MAG: DUF2336 domain-containing protein [Micavibrio aeruginosavorus]|uniref:DUF2336 domain-containing protein n=1 Tax=Micavibrio aeruginosavorus TaxID=349221 RepID=A0A7T5UHJ5_9BACT|nr:MAG: DUF2336 domain-containing protein [Micavibrio aeruginosavorus]